jgi:hypothetical protein
MRMIIDGTGLAQGKVRETRFDAACESLMTLWQIRQRFQGSDGNEAPFACLNSIHSLWQRLLSRPQGRSRQAEWFLVDARREETGNAKAVNRATPRYTSRLSSAWQRSLVEVVVTIDCCWSSVNSRSVPLPVSFLLVYISQISPVLVPPVLLIFILYPRIHHTSWFT